MRPSNQIADLQYGVRVVSFGNQSWSISQANLKSRDRLRFINIQFDIFLLCSRLGRCCWCGSWLWWIGGHGRDNTAKTIAFSRKRHYFWTRRRCVFFSSTILQVDMNLSTRSLAIQFLWNSPRVMQYSEECPWLFNLILYPWLTAARKRWFSGFSYSRNSPSSMENPFSHMRRRNVRGGLSWGSSSAAGFTDDASPPDPNL